MEENKIQTKHLISVKLRNDKEKKKIPRQLLTNEKQQWQQYYWNKELTN